jgi:hypothetical protein
MDAGERFLQQVIYDNRLTKSSDPRDKVYALLTMSTTTLQADYTLSNRNLFWKTLGSCSDGYDCGSLRNFAFLLVEVLEIGIQSSRCETCRQDCSPLDDYHLNKIVAYCRSPTAQPWPEVGANVSVRSNRLGYPATSEVISLLQLPDDVRILR